MKKDLRILHVIASLSPAHGGTTSAVTQMIDGLEKLGVKCDIALTDDDGPGKRLSAGASERRIKGRHYFPKEWEFYKYSPKMAAWLSANLDAYDLVHIHGLFSHVNGLAGRICKRKGRPYIVTPHGMANRYGMSHKPLLKRVSFALIERSLLENASKVHVTSKGEERDFTSLSVSTSTIRIPLAVTPMAPGKAEAFYNDYPELRGKKLAVFVGRLNPVKNVESIIEAITLLEAEGWHVAICGEGPSDYTAELQSRAIELGLSDRIFWLGHVSGEKKANVLAAGDIYLQPSHSESFGMAAIEAVSAGLPCLLGANVGVGEDLEKAGFASVIPVTPNGIALGLGAHKPLGRKATGFRKKAREMVTREYNTAALGMALADCYQIAIDGGVDPNDSESLAKRIDTTSRTDLKT